MEYLSYSAKSIVKAIVFILVHLLSDQEIQLTLHLRSQPLQPQPSHPSFKATSSSTERIKIFICFFWMSSIESGHHPQRCNDYVWAVRARPSFNSHWEPDQTEALIFRFFKQIICSLNCSAIGVLEVVYKLVPTNVEFKLG